MSLNQKSKTIMKTLGTIFIAMILFLAIPKTSFAATCGTISDASGNLYNTVVIGTQCWITENLRTTKKPDGTNLTEGAGMYSNSAGSGSPWGKLYNWNTAMNGSASASTAGAEIQGICPDGWHVPSDYHNPFVVASDDWQKLSNFLGGDAVSGGKLKSTDSALWTIPNTGASNTVGFSGVPSGIWESISGTFRFRGTHGYFWTSSENINGNAWNYYIRNSQVIFSQDFNSKSNGLAVRCVKSSVINVSSNISSSWTITGPVTITGSGTSQATFAKPAGTYAITWGAVSGYVAPATQSLTLVAGGTISFDGTYVVVVPVTYTCYNPEPVCPETMGNISCIDNDNNSVGISNCGVGCIAKTTTCATVPSSGGNNWREVMP